MTSHNRSSRPFLTQFQVSEKSRNYRLAVSFSSALSDSVTVSSQGVQESLVMAESLSTVSPSVVSSAYEVKFSGCLS